jgi:hypothetical protein
MPSVAEDLGGGRREVIEGYLRLGNPTFDLIPLEVKSVSINDFKSLLQPLIMGCNELAKRWYTDQSVPE